MKDVREEYHAEGLSEANLHTDPVEQARRWVDEAIEAGLPLPNAMTLATVSADGQPSSRVVLLKGIEGGGFTFFTHYDSRKGMKKSPTVILRRGPMPARSAPPSPLRASPPAGNGWKRKWRLCRRNIRKPRSPARPTGAATVSCPRKSSSGMAAPVDCMIVFAIANRQTGVGYGSGLRRKGS